MSRKSRRRAQMQKGPTEVQGSRRAQLLPEGVRTPGDTASRAPAGPANLQGSRAEALVPLPGQGPSRYNQAAGPPPPNSISDVDLGSNVWSPFQPVAPFGPPSVNYPRTYDYPVGINLDFAAGGRLSFFKMLQVMSRSWGILRSIIETRKDQLMRIPWDVQLIGKPKVKDHPRLNELRNFLKRPDGQNNFSTWMRMQLEDKFVIDAANYYVWKDRGGKPLALMHVAGETIKPLIDDAGRRPEYPNPCAQQIIKGLPWENLDASEFLYAPQRPTPQEPMYGYSEVQMIYIEILQGIRKMLYKLDYWMEGSIPSLIITVPEGWCYSEDTEVLTRRGWLRFNEVDIATDDFATRSPNQEFQWQRATGINLTHYDGDMVALTSGRINCLVNPPHRVLLAYLRSDGSYDERIVTAGELAEYHSDSQKIPVTSTWSSGVEIAEKAFVHEQTQGPCRDIMMTGDQFCAFMGMYLSEGSLHSGDRGVVIAQSKESKGYWPFYGLLSEIFGRELVTYYDAKKCFAVGNAPLGRYLSQFGTASEKFVPEEIMNATSRQIDIFLRFHHLGDGSSDRELIGTSSKKMADQLQELYQKVGRSAIIGADDRRGRQVKFGDRVAMTNYVSYGVSASRHKVRKFKVSTQKYSGTIGCVSVPNGILYVRRKGKPCWSGNTPEQLAAFQAHTDFMLAGNLQQKARIRFMPSNSKPFDIKNANGEALKTDEDEWVTRLACYTFSVSPTPFIKQMNRATAESAAQEAQEEGLHPLMTWTKENLIDPAIQSKTLGFGYDDCEYVWLPEPEVDAQKQMMVLTGYGKVGMMTYDEAREQLNLGPLPDGAGKDPIMDTPNGPIPLKETLESNRQKALAVPDQIDREGEKHDMTVESHDASMATQKQNLQQAKQNGDQPPSNNNGKKPGVGKSADAPFREGLPRRALQKKSYDWDALAQAGARRRGSAGCREDHRPGD